MRGSVGTLQSHFMYLPLDDRLQSLSWLFKGALSCCMSDTSLPACKGREARATCCLNPQHEMEQNPGACRKDQRSSRKCMPWSTEEADLLLRLRREEKRPWAEVTRLFLEEFPGRSPGAIQVYIPYHSLLPILLLNQARIRNITSFIMRIII
ncbi:hypothetical protein BDV06DRAFT_133105 [Aspergillus oleicola]